MRIIAGEFRGRTLKAPKGVTTRPTTDRVRESVMSMVASIRGSFENCVVLDAFAGSGALGLEALSRGARCVHFYERDFKALCALNENVQALDINSSSVFVHKDDVLRNPPLNVNVAFDLIFLDPPYALAAQDVLGMIAQLREGGALGSEALVVYEHSVATSDEATQTARLYNLPLARRKKYGDTVIDILRCAVKCDVSTNREGQELL